jgi:hypothetical protein
MHKQLRAALLAAYTTRTETFEGREHLVVPVVALVQGVVYPMTAKGYEYVDASELRASGWDGRPVFLGHPLESGAPVSGNEPTRLESDKIGTVFNTAVHSGKLNMEAWIDVEKCATVAPDLLTRLQAGESIEISVGAFVDMEETTGVYGGKAYAYAWHDIVPDHLALLPKGDLGACSNAMGCGVRAASQGKPTMKKMPGLLQRVLSAFRGLQPADEMSDTDLRKKLGDALKDVEHQSCYVQAFLPVTAPNRVVYEVYRMPFGEAPGEYELYQRAFSLSESGAVTLDASKVLVEPVMAYEPVLFEEDALVAAAGKRHSKYDEDMIQQMHDHAIALGAACQKLTNAGAGAPCSCQSPAPVHKEHTMTKEALMAFLATATPDQIKAMSVAAGETPVVPVADEKPPVTEKPAVTEVVAAKAPTFAELLAAADPSTREAIAEGKRQGDAKRAATIAALKATTRCTFTDEELAAMPTANLEKLSALSAIPSVDFSGLGAPRTPDASLTEAPPVPDLVAAMARK